MRPKKVVLFPEISRLKILYHLPAHISRMCMYLYLFKKHTHTNSKFIRTNLRFFPFKQLKIGLFVFQ